MDPTSQGLQLRRAGVPQFNIHRDIGVSVATGTDQRHGWHRLDGGLSVGDTLIVVRVDRIGNSGAQPSSAQCVNMPARDIVACATMWYGLLS